MITDLIQEGTVSTYLCQVTCAAGWSLAALALISHVDDYECVDYDGRRVPTLPRAILPSTSSLQTARAIYHDVGSKRVELRLRAASERSITEKLEYLLDGMVFYTRVVRLPGGT